MSPALHWSTRYLGRPWVSGASGPEAYDCWGLVRRVYAEICGRALAEAGLVAEDGPRARAVAFAIHPQRVLFTPVDAPSPLDVVLMGRRGAAFHVGLAIEDGLVLHAHENGGVRADDRLQLAALGLGFVGFRRWTGP